MEIITYSEDVDILLLKVSDNPVEYATEVGQVIVHFSHDDEAVLLEIQDAKNFVAQSYNRMFKDVAVAGQPE